MGRTTTEPAAPARPHRVNSGCACRLSKLKSSGTDQFPSAGFHAMMRQCPMCVRHFSTQRLTSLRVSLGSSHRHGHWFFSLLPNLVKAGTTLELIKYKYTD